MLKMMRQSFRHLKWILWFVVIVFVAFVFVDWGMGRARGDRATSGEIATVGGDRITAVDFSRQYQQTQERYRQMYKDNWTPALAKALDLPNQVLNGMIERRMLIEAARRSGVRVSDAELSEKIQSLPALQRNGQFIGAREYSNLLAANGMTADQFERDFRDDMMIEKYNRLVSASLIVPDSEVESQFARQSEKAKIDYVLISPDHFEAAAAPTEAELLAAFEKNKERYRQPERRKLKYLLIDETRLREKIRPTPAQIRAYYDSHPDDFPVSDRVHAAHILIKVDRDAKPDVDAAAKKKAEDLAARARKGEDFAKLAEKYSEDPGSKERGGDLGPFARGSMVKAFEDAAFSMTPGQISDPVRSPFGYHVIKLIEKLPPGKQTFEEAAPKIVATLQESAVKAEEARRSEALEKAVSRNSSDEDLRKLADDVVSFDATDWVTRAVGRAGRRLCSRFHESRLRAQKRRSFAARDLDSARPRHRESRGREAAGDTRFRGGEIEGRGRRQERADAAESPRFRAADRSRAPGRIDARSGREEIRRDGAVFAGIREGGAGPVARELGGAVRGGLPDGCRKAGRSGLGGAAGSRAVPGRVQDRVRPGGVRAPEGDDSRIDPAAGGAEADPDGSRAAARRGEDRRQRRAPRALQRGLGTRR